MNETTPKISVIVPVYKAENYLHRCVDSLLAQTFQDFEILLIDDGSPDRSGEICDEYARKDKRVRVFHKENGGVVIAREEGIRRSKGYYLCFVDADDFLDVNMLEALLVNLCKENSDISICSFEYIDSSCNSIKINHDFWIGDSKEDALESLFLRKCTWSLCAKIFKKELFHDIIMPYGVKMGEDGLVCFQAVSRANKVSYIDYSYYKYFQHSSSTIHSFDKSISDSILSFIDLTYQFRKIYNWSQRLDKPLKDFVISQVFVYYVYGGEIKQLLKTLPEKISLEDVLRSELSFKEKILSMIYLKINPIAVLLRKKVRKLCLGIF